MAFEIQTIAQQTDGGPAIATDMVFAQRENAPVRLTAGAIAALGGGAGPESEAVIEPISNPATVIPEAIGLLYYLTSDNQIYVSTGTSAGQLLAIGITVAQLNSAATTAANAAVSAHAAAANPHPTYTDAAELAAAISAHAAAANPHPAYIDTAELAAATASFISEVEHASLIGDYHGFTVNITGVGEGNTPATVEADFIDQRIINVGVTPNQEYRAIGTGPGEVVPIGAAAAGAGHIIRDETAALASRNNLDFIGTTVTAADSQSENATKITINPLLRLTTAQLQALTTGALDAIYLNTDNGRFGSWDPSIDNGSGGFIFT
jgi:hypothetical protein